MNTAVALVALCMCAAVASVAAWLAIKNASRKSPSSPGSPGSTSSACADASFGPAAAWAAPSGTSAMHQRNARVVADMNASGGCFDFVLYGDSITAFLGENPDVFARHFGDKKAAALGVSGNSVEQLAWRIMNGDERPARAPQCIAFNIGINNVIWGNFQAAAAHMEELLTWCRAAYPSTRLVLMALLPASRQFGDVSGANRTYRAIAQRLGITFADCGAGMNPSRRELYSDGLHPTAQGHDVVLRQLRGYVKTA